MLFVISYKSFFLQGNALGSIPFQFTDHFRIHLGSGKVAMGKQLTDSVNVCSTSQLQGGEGMTETVEGNMLGNTGIRNPVFQVGSDYVWSQFAEHLALSTFPA